MFSYSHYWLSSVNKTDFESHLVTIGISRIPVQRPLFETLFSLFPVLLPGPPVTHHLPRASSSSRRSFCNIQTPTLPFMASIPSLFDELPPHPLPPHPPFFLTSVGGAGLSSLQALGGRGGRQELLHTRPRRRPNDPCKKFDGASRRLATSPPPCHPKQCHRPFFLEFPCHPENCTSC